MNSIKTYLNSLGRGVRTTVLALAVVFISAGIAQAATTISTSITTGGTLSVTGLATLLGGATTTQITLLSGDTIKNASASSTVISGALNTTGALSSSVGVSGTTGTFSSTLGITGLATFLGGASTTQFTLLSGDTIKNASASTTVMSGVVQATGGVLAQACARAQDARPFMRRQRKTAVSGAGLPGAATGGRVNESAPTWRLTLK